MQNQIRLACLTVLISISCGLSAKTADNYKGIRDMIDRRIPSLSGKVDIIPIPLSANKKDSFNIYTGNNQLVIEASSKSAAAVALNFYLEEFCHMSISHNGSNIRDIKDPIPEIREKISRTTKFRYRYALNYCTYNYSYSFYNWDDWEMELDWIVLNGVNLMLAPLGTEVIWYNVLKKLGCKDNEIKQFIAGPGYTAWWLMGNLEGWGGPMSHNMMKQRADMQRKILQRMKELGIEPVLQGFCGMVPAGLANKFPDAPIREQGKWVHIFNRPSLLLPDSPLFNKMADCWYKELKRQYGDHIRFLGGDLFHEGGDTTGINLCRTAKLVQENMQRNIPGATWILQGWSGNPKSHFLAGTNPENTIVINLFGESSSSWKDSDEFNHTPWIWASVNHFGGKTDMGGQLPLIIREPHNALAESSGYLCGIGIIPEGVYANPVVYDWALKTAWESSVPCVSDYIDNYIRYRYGKGENNIRQAWELLTNSIYGDFKIKGEGTFESIFCARPGLDVTSTSTWGPKRYQYNPEILTEALICFRNAAENFISSDTYSYDLTDLSRQVLCNYARTVYERSIFFYKNKDIEQFKRESDLFVSLIELQDRLVGTRKEFLVGNWLDKAASYGTCRKDNRLSEKNARMLITLWGPETPTTKLMDYANKEWSGLLEDYYLPRWKAFYNYLNNRLKGEDVSEPDYFQIERAWIYNNKTYPCEPNGLNILELTDKVIQYVSEQCDFLCKN